MAPSTVLLPALLVVCTCAGRVAAFAAPVSCLNPKVSQCFESAWDSISSKQDLRAVDHIANYLEENGCWSAGNASGQVEGQQGKKVDWVVKHSATVDGVSRMALNAWTQPMFDVPHLSASISEAGEDLIFELDLISKADMANDKIYVEKYYSWANDFYTKMQDAGQPLPPASLLVSRIIAGPINIRVKLANTDSNVDLAVSSVNQVLERWLDWLEDATEIPRVRRGTMLVRDNNLKRLSWTIACADPMNGGSQDAARAIAGPGDEAYIGQGS